MRAYGGFGGPVPGSFPGLPGDTGIPGATRTTPGDHQNPYLIFPGIFPGDLPSVREKWTFWEVPEASRTFPASSGDEISRRIRISGPGASKTTRNTRTTGTIRIPRVGFGTDRPYTALFWDRPSGTCPGCGPARSAAEEALMAIQPAEPSCPELVDMVERVRSPTSMSMVPLESSKEYAQPQIVVKIVLFLKILFSLKLGFPSF